MRDVWVPAVESSYLPALFASSKMTSCEQRQRSKFKVRRNALSEQDLCKTANFRTKMFVWRTTSTGTNLINEGRVGRRIILDC